MTIGILPLIKKVFNSEEMDKRDEKFLNYLSEHLQKPFKKIDKNSIKSVELPIIFIRSGGVEGDFKELFSKLKPPYILLTPDRRSALAAALEISYYIRKKGFDAEIIHGEEIYMVNRIKALDKIFSAKKQIKNSNIGIVGNSANWLIASDVDKNRIKDKLGISFVEISEQRVIDAFKKATGKLNPYYCDLEMKWKNKKELLDALRMYEVLENIAYEFKLNGMTVASYDFLELLNTSDSLALSLLNKEGIVAGSEGDLSSVLSMYIMHHITSQPVFEANPCKLIVNNNEVILAHSTLPYNMAKNIQFLTHFESGKSIGLKGKIKRGRGTIFKLSGDLKEYFVSGVDILDNLNEPFLSRTQVKVKLDEPINYFLTKSIGNHHILCKKDYKKLLEYFCEYIN